MRYRFWIAPALALCVLAAAPRGLPPLPGSVYSRYGFVPVVRVAKVVCPDSSGVTDPRVIGCFTMGLERTVQIADTLDARWSWIVLFHEETHIAFRDVGLRFDHREDEERIAWVVARWRLGELEGHP